MLKINYLKNHAKKTRDFILDILFPINCVSCNLEGGWICHDCFNGLSNNSDFFCLACRTRNHNGEFCRNCQKEYQLNGVLIAGDYQNPILSKLIKTYKYHFAKDISAILGLYVEKFIEKNCTDKNSKLFNMLKNPKSALIIPVPLHKKRIRWRGFNQSELLAKIIAKQLNIEIDYFSLARKRNTIPQTRLNEDDRKMNLLNAFFWQGDSLANKNIILIDDVVTTGSTLNECSKILKQNGANEVWGLVVANG